MSVSSTAKAVREKLPSRSEKEEFATFFSNKFCDATFRKSFLDSPGLARARGVLRQAALRAKVGTVVRCLEHRATVADLVSRGAANAPLSDEIKKQITDHWAKLQNAAKGSRKILKRRQKLIDKMDKGDFRHKHKKHQSRHY